MRRRQQTKATGRKPNPRRQVLLDTGPLVGLYNANDEWHKRAVQFFGEVQFRFIITDAVMNEVISQIQRDKDPSRAFSAVSSFLTDVYSKLYTLHQTRAVDLERILELRNTYSDQNIDFADLTLVLAAERHDVSEIVTVDSRDFHTLRWGNRRYFNVIAPDVSLLD